MSSNPKTSLALLAIVSGLFGLIACLIGAVDIYAANQSLYWHQALGVITRSEIQEVAVGEGVSYKPWIEYVYRVTGKQYQGTTVYIGDRGAYGKTDYADRYVAKYSVNQTVSVYYNPSQPNASTLEAGVQKGAFGLPAMGIGFAVMGIGFYLGEKRRWMTLATTLFIPAWVLFMVWLFQP